MSASSGGVPNYKIVHMIKIKQMFYGFMSPNSSAWSYNLKMQNTFISPKILDERGQPFVGLYLCFSFLFTPFSLTRRSFSFSNLPFCGWFLFRKARLGIFCAEKRGKIGKITLEIILKCQIYQVIWFSNEKCFTEPILIYYCSYLWIFTTNISLIYSHSYRLCMWIRFEASMTSERSGLSLLFLSWDCKK